MAMLVNVSNIGGGMAMMQCSRSSGGDAKDERTRARQIAAAAGIDGDDEVNNDRDGNIPEVLLVLGPPLVVGELDLLRSI
jgi:hypothetical protein